MRTNHRIGLVYETFDTYPGAVGAPVDAAVEYEPEETVAGLERALAKLGHTPVRIGSPRALLARLGTGAALGIDVALNIAEGEGTRNREAWAPVLLEMAGVPCIGSDASSLSLTLDKYWTNRLLAQAGVPTVDGISVSCAGALATQTLPGPFPLFVKPRWEGTAKGIRPSSRVEDAASLRAEVERVTHDYAQPALVERFLPGAEYTVTVVGHAPPRALPVLQRALERVTQIGLHALEGPERGAGAPALEHDVPGALTPELEAELGALGLRAHALLECRDFSRSDFRLDADGRPCFLEINPLPTFAPDGSFGILAELMGRSLEDLLGEILAAGIARLAAEGRLR